MLIEMISKNMISNKSKKSIVEVPRLEAVSSAKSLVYPPQVFVVHNAP